MTRLEVHSISRVLADPRRFDILKSIAAKTRADLKCEFPITAATLSYHLKELETCGVVETERCGKFIITFRRQAWTLISKN